MPIAHPCPTAQTLLQPPQFWGSLVVSTQLDPQAVVPAAHAHMLAAQTCRLAHARPQAPQFAGSFVTSVHAPPHARCAPGQTHAPA
jgi:hypothetical protein